MANGFLEGVVDVASGVQEGGRQAANDFLTGLQVKTRMNNQKFQQRFNAMRSESLEIDTLSKQFKSIKDPVAQSAFVSQQQAKENISQGASDFLGSLEQIEVGNRAKYTAGINSVNKLIASGNPSQAITELDALDAESGGETPTSIRMRGNIQNEADQTILEGVDILNDIKTKLDDKDELTPEEIQNLMGIMEQTAGEMSRASFEASDRGKEVLEQFQEAGSGDGVKITPSIQTRREAIRDPKGEIAKSLEAEEASKIRIAESLGAGREKGKLLVKTKKIAATQLAALDNIDSLFKEKFVGPIQGGFLGTIKAKTGIGLTKEEANFRSAVKKNAAELRRFYFGTAQTQTELKNSLEAIPDTNMPDVAFEAAIEQTRVNVRNALAGLEDGSIAVRGDEGGSASFSPEEATELEALLKE